ncbi:MAG: hypothetical protein NVV59_17855 [Chitinophagaceae bacterium]|nr:hypothetical protein [Chitinophagaceae bacterium]
MDQIKKKKRKDRKPLAMLLAVLIFFVAFIYFISRPSAQTRAIELVNACNSIDDAKSLYDRHKFDLIETDENGGKVVSIAFQDAIRNKLNQLIQDENELNYCLKWLPPGKTSLNLIVVPDLSRRIIDSFNNPGQISNDTLLLNVIWDEFVKFSRFRQDTKDRFIVDVTDIGQAQGKFRLVADSLYFDLAAHTGRSNRLYFTPAIADRFERYVKKMYDLAKPPMGADYFFYFSRTLKSRLKYPTIFENVTNKIILITDGYMETKSADRTNTKHSAFKHTKGGNLKELIQRTGISIPKLPLDLSNTQILICEVNERKKSAGKRF